MSLFIRARISCFRRPKWYKKSKKFKQSEEHIFYALKDVSLNIKKGSIFGIIGLSGAGKSTLLRAIACLENVDSASIIIDGINILQLKGSQLRNFRKNIFIYQNN